MKSQSLQRSAALVGALFLFTMTVSAQSGSVRPRRVNPQPAPASRADDEETPRQPVDPSPVANRNNNATTAANRNNNATADTSHAFALLQQKQYADALAEAKRLTVSYPNDSETWKIAGFAEKALKQYPQAASDLQRALELQRTAGKEDPFTVDALAHTYILTEQFDRALPLLVSATARPGAKPDAALLFYRGLAEYRTGKAADAERTFKAVVADNPKDAAALFYLGQIAYERNDLDAAIASLNRATTSDARSASAWALLTSAYLRRAAGQTGPKAEADALGAVRAGEGLTHVRTDNDAMVLFGQALIAAKQYARAATTLERAASAPDAPASVLYLTGVANSRAKNLPKAITALERAATQSPDDLNIYRELGYAYEVARQYAKALAAYQKGLSLAPNDANFKESADRVRPFAN